MSLRRYSNPKIYSWPRSEKEVNCLPAEAKPSSELKPLDPPFVLYSVNVLKLMDGYRRGFHYSTPREWTVWSLFLLKFVNWQGKRFVVSTLSRICAHTCGLDFPASLTDVEETNCLENANTRRHFTVVSHMREKHVLAEKASRKIIRGVQIVENQVVVKRDYHSQRTGLLNFTQAASQVVDTRKR